MHLIRVQSEVFDVASEMARMQHGRTDVGALVSFVGLVRDFNERPEVTALTLEHYPGMTEAELERIAEQAATRWPLQAVTIIHRVGRLQPGDPIVLVLVASAHRQAAFDGCNYVMDYLKTRAPFWKKEHTRNGDYWVSARDSDAQAQQRWEKNNNE